MSCEARVDARGQLAFPGQTADRVAAFGKRGSDGRADAAAGARDCNGSFALQGWSGSLGRQRPLQFLRFESSNQIVRKRPLTDCTQIDRRFAGEVERVPRLR